eukprot:CAMPEP_0167774580 /NCGR_PEP_ID=MMETSP0111_2-20121227/2081_1 /TAXON_ID=91324 /ORGANISM="Lotharella globosa, Strain CCCM811" /LENGTH=240 /DNA_ID=CAMNT_0007664397 /DNA_START=601 /DNA_END=1320 /DNA_ORIENTATION=-
MGFEPSFQIGHDERPFVFVRQNGLLEGHLVALLDQLDVGDELARGGDQIPALHLPAAILAHFHQLPVEVHVERYRVAGVVVPRVVVGREDGRAAAKRGGALATTVAVGPHPFVVARVFVPEQIAHAPDGQLLPVDHPDVHLVQAAVDGYLPECGHPGPEDRRAQHAAGGRGLVHLGHDRPVHCHPARRIRDFVRKPELERHVRETKGVQVAPQAGDRFGELETGPHPHFRYVEGPACRPA